MSEITRACAYINITLGVLTLFCQIIAWSGGELAAISLLISLYTGFACIPALLTLAVLSKRNHVWNLETIIGIVLGAIGCLCYAWWIYSMHKGLKKGF